LLKISLLPVTLSVTDYSKFLFIPLAVLETVYVIKKTYDITEFFCSYWIFRFFC